MSSGLIEWLAFIVAALLALDSWHWEKRGRKELERRARVCAAIVAFLLGLRLFVLEPFHGLGPSMLPTLPEKSVVVVDKSSFGWRIPGLDWWVFRRSSPSPGDVVVSEITFQGQPEMVLKRIVAVGGDVVRVEGERLFVNDVPVEGPEVSPGVATGAWRAQVLGHTHYVWLKENAYRLSDNIVTWRVPPGFVFLVGDNRQVSYDSRVFGPIPEKNVVGKVLGVWKEGRLGLLDTGQSP